MLYLYQIVLKWFNNISQHFYGYSDKIFIYDPIWPGRWRLRATSTGQHSLRVTGLSTLDFLARFSRKPTLNWTETEFQPVAGIIVEGFDKVGC